MTTVFTLRKRKILRLFQIAKSHLGESHQSQLRLYSLLHQILKVPN